MDAVGDSPAFESLAPMVEEGPQEARRLLAEAAQAPTAEARAQMAGRLNLLLAEMARGGGSREVADLLHELLEGGGLEGLVDAQGRASHAAAVEALASLGFPYALEVRPEDAQRVWRPPPARDWRDEVPVVGTLLVGVLWQFASDSMREVPPTFPLLLPAFTAFALVAALAGKPDSKLRTSGAQVMALASLVGLIFSVIPGYSGAAFGLAGLGAAILAVRQGR
ncbi:hypothetical protein P2318_06695 [Myxococcaceae bacterium GXIMD 01537]